MRIIELKNFHRVSDITDEIIPLPCYFKCKAKNYQTDVVNKILNSKKY